MLRRTLFALALAGVGLVLVAISDAQPSLAQDDLTKLIEHDAKAVQDLFAKKLDAKRMRRVKMGAFLIAAYAQEGGMGDLRDRAVKLIHTVEKDPAAAKKLAAELKPGKGGEKLKAIALEKELDLESFMKTFSSERAGGFAVEKTLEDLIEIKGALGGEAKAKALVTANKITMMAQFAHGFAPEKDDVAKTKKAWQEFAKNTQTAAKDLAATIRKGGDFNKAAEHLSMSCVKCHDVFRTPQ